MENESCVYLRGVDLVNLTERYLKGEFVGLVKPFPVNSIIEERPSSVITTGDKTSKRLFEFDPGCGRTFAYIGYRITEKDGKYSFMDPDSKYYCMYCLYKIKGEPMGIPIRREQQDDKIYFHMIDIFCCFECILAELRRRSNNSLYSQSMAYISELFTLCTGKDISELHPASDQRLLKRFNGPMSWAEFHANTVRYMEKPGNVYFFPVIEYIERDST